MMCDLPPPNSHAWPAIDAIAGRAYQTCWQPGRWVYQAKQFSARRCLPLASDGWPTCQAHRRRWRSGRCCRGHTSTASAPRSRAQTSILAASQVVHSSNAASRCCVTLVACRRTLRRAAVVGSEDWPALAHPAKLRCGRRRGLFALGQARRTTTFLSRGLFSLCLSLHAAHPPPSAADVPHKVGASCCQPSHTKCGGGTVHSNQRQAINVGECRLAANPAA